MRQMRRVIVGLVAMVVLVLASGSVQAQTTSNGPYYATPAWDQKLDCTSLATCPRFIVLSNWNSEAVLDRETGLVWQKSPPATTGEQWILAHQDCRESSVGNRRGWRLPTIEELSSLFDPSQSNPSLPPGHPFANVQNAYWSATTRENDPTFAWVVLFGTNFVNGINSTPKTSTTVNFWCVRGGQGVDPQ